MRHMTTKDMTLLNHKDIKGLKLWIDSHTSDIEDIYNLVNQMNKNITSLSSKTINNNEKVISKLDYVDDTIQEKVKNEIHNEFKSFESRLESSILEVKKDFEKEDELSSSDVLTQDDLEDLEVYNKSLIKDNNKKISKNIKKSSKMTILTSTIINIVVTISSIVAYDLFIKKFITTLLN